MDLDDDNDGLADCWNFIEDPTDPWNLLTTEEQLTAIESGSCLDFTLSNDSHPLFINLLNNYPNPFNPSTIISFYVISPSIIDIDIYDLEGHKIQDLTEGFYQTGSHQLEWIPDSKISSGIYLISLKTSNSLINHKILYLK